MAKKKKTKKKDLKNNKPEIKTSLLKNVPMFSGLSKDELSTAAESSEIIHIEPDEEIFSAGDPANHSYVVISGAVEILRKEDSSIMGAPPKESLIARMMPGDSFGEMELLTEQNHNEIARAADKSQILLFPARGISLEYFLKDRCLLGARMLFSFLKSTAARQRQVLNVIKENSPEIQELRNQVYRDKLTGLFNKTYLEEELPRLMKKHEKLALIMYKPDNFKEINDTFGHEAGDQVIVLMAADLTRYAGKNDTTVRYMGNELALLLPGRGREEALKDAETMLERTNSLDISSTTGGEKFRITASFGISLYPDHASSAEELIALAHELPLVGRGRGGNRILFPEEKQHERR